MVHEVEGDVVGVVGVWRLDSGGELLQLGVGGLFDEPVVVVEPVVAERGEVGESWPFGVGGLVASGRNWRAGIGDALADIVDEARFDVDSERRWGAAVGGAYVGEGTGGLNEGYCSAEEEQRGYERLHDASHPFL